MIACCADKGDADSISSSSKIVWLWSSFLFNAGVDEVSTSSYGIKGSESGISKPSSAAAGGILSEKEEEEAADVEGITDCKSLLETSDGNVNSTSELPSMIPGDSLDMPASVAIAISVGAEVGTIAEDDTANIEEVEGGEGEALEIVEELRLGSGELIHLLSRAFCRLEFR